MISPSTAVARPPRNVYMVLSPRALPYARIALGSLLAHSVEPLCLRLITDARADATELEEALGQLPSYAQHSVSVHDEDALLDAEAERFAGLTHLRAFRHGHPCWRKITDPLLLSAPGQELVLLDPDLYFPNRFHFETTAATGVQLMWQKPNCLLPAEVVRTAFAAGLKLARHVDIGVCHWREGSDLEWLDWTIARLGGNSLPPKMHIEAIVWAAIAMREGGGYLDPRLWVCWHRTQRKRLQRKLGISGPRILAPEPWNRMKCFHAGGEAKWWLPELLAQGDGRPAAATVAGPGEIRPFVELSRDFYEREQRAKSLLRNLGYYRFFAASPA